MHSKDLQIDWLRTFLAVVDTGSVTAAARQVSRSQSAVSMQLKKLEESVGRPLLNRGPSKLERGEIDLAIMTRDTPNRGELLFREGLVWVGSERHEVWKRDPLPIAVHGIDSRLRAVVIAAISAQQRSYRVVYNSPNIVGQLAAAESGVAVAVITRCCLPASLKMLDERDGLPQLPDVEVALVRSKHAKRSAAVEVMHEQVIRSLKNPI